MDELLLYRDLAEHPWMAGPEQMALLEGLELSGPEHVASSPEPSTHDNKATLACARPAAISKLHSGSQVIIMISIMPGSHSPVWPASLAVI